MIGSANQLKPLVNIVRLGRVRYWPALKLQEHLVEKVKAIRQRQYQDNCAKESSNDATSSSTSGQYLNYLLILEHNPVYTTGIRNRMQYANEAKETDFAALGADFVQTDRGGLITFHGPGQLVAYPILDLEHFIPQACNEKRAKLVGMRWYVHTLEQTIIDMLKDDFQLASHRSPYTGVWLGAEENERKICAMGVHNSQLVTSHGLALNCNTDMKWFNHIVPCGIEGKAVTSLSNEHAKSGLHGSEITVNDAIPSLIKHFRRNFQCDIRESDSSSFADFMSNVPCDHSDYSSSRKLL